MQVQELEFTLEQQMAVLVFRIKISELLNRHSLFLSAQEMHTLKSLENRILL